ncbi:MAG: hypothetical protein IJN72_00810 [Firmicutes bacterium]|nr:hypothetical protein [Bacillota bacterium]
MSNDNEKIITSKTLHAELNEERKKDGLYEIPEVNGVRSSTGTIAGKDKSFSSSFDFFRQMLGKKDK